MSAPFSGFFQRPTPKIDQSPQRILLKPSNLHPETLSAVNAQTRHERANGGVVNIKKPGTNLGLLMETMGSVASAVRAGRTEGLSADLYRLAARSLGWAERLDEAHARALQREQRAARQASAARPTSAADADE